MGEQRQDEEGLQETWRDWVPDAPEPDLAGLYTRAEILAALAQPETTPPVTESDLRFWEYRGVLPRPIRRRKDGATRALYPPWYAVLVRRLRIFQQTGHTLDQLPSRLRAEARRLAHGDPIEIRGGGRISLGLAAALEELPQGAPFRYPTLPQDAEATLRHVLGGVAATIREQDGFELERASILLEDRHGKGVIFNITLPTPAQLAESEALARQLLREGPGSPLWEKHLGGPSESGPPPATRT